MACSPDGCTVVVSWAALLRPSSATASSRRVPVDDPRRQTVEARVGRGKEQGTGADGDLVKHEAGTVTFLFTDIEGSTRLLKRLRERYEQALAEHDRILRKCNRRRGWADVDTQGDAFFAAFPTARGAIAAAVTAQQSLAETGLARERPAPGSHGHSHS